MLRSEVVIQSSHAGIHFHKKASLIVSLLCCGVHFFNDLSIVHFHFCLCKLNWRHAAGCLRRETWACCFSMELGEDGNSVGKNRFLFLKDYSVVLAFIMSTFISAFPPCRDMLFMGIFAKEWQDATLLANHLSLMPSF